MCTPRLFSLLIACLLSGFVGAAEHPARVTVWAGEFDRSDTIVKFALPASASGRHVLSGPDGALVELQVDAAGQATFIEPRLLKGASKPYRLIKKPETGVAAMVVAAKDGRRLKIESNGKPVLSYQAEPSDPPREDIKPIYRRGGYIHPVHSPSGLVVTDDYPSNHTHHHGIWFPWTKTAFEGRAPDFWNMGQGKGTVEFVALDGFWSGPVHAGFRARHRFVDLTSPEPKVALHETWEVTVYRGGTGSKPYWLFDLVSTQHCATSSPLKLPEYYYGGLGLRGNWGWNGEGKAFFLTSEGETDRVKGNSTRGRWCHIGGAVDGQKTGLAVLGHPENFRAPQPMRLHPGEPFFCFAPSQLGDWEIVPGQPYVSRYRFFVQDGPPDSKLIERMWNDYAHPPVVKVEAD